MSLALSDFQSILINIVSMMDPDHNQANLDVHCYSKEGVSFEKVMQNRLDTVVVDQTAPVGKPFNSLPSG